MQSVNLTVAQLEGVRRFAHIAREAEERIYGWIQGLQRATYMFATIIPRASHYRCVLRTVYLSAVTHAISRVLTDLLR